MSATILIGKILDHRYNEFRPGRLRLEGNKIAAVTWGEFGPEKGAVYYPESFIAPGFIELQLNGGLGYDFTETPESVSEVATALPRWGVTSFLPTVITSPTETYLSALRTIKSRMNQTSGAQILGVHLEGPFLNPQFRGAHKPEWLQLPTLAKAEAILETGALRLLTLAPELPGALEVIEILSKQDVLVSMGHSAATYEQAQAGYEAGARYATHLFNAMPPLHHRKPGLVNAVLTTPDITGGIIVDGIHLHPSIVQLIYQAKGAASLNLVTDAMAGMGMPSGRYQLSGQSVIVDETSAHLEDAVGTLAGSILTLDAAVRNMAKWSNCGLAQSIQMATLNPADLLNLPNKGRIEAGCDADIVILSEAGEIEKTLIAGEIAFEKSMQVI